MRIFRELDKIDPKELEALDLEAAADALILLGYVAEASAVRDYLKGQP